MTLILKTEAPAGDIMCQVERIVPLAKMENGMGCRLEKTRVVV